VIVAKLPKILQGGFTHQHFKSKQSETVSDPIDAHTKAVVRARVIIDLQCNHSD